MTDHAELSTSQVQVLDQAGMTLQVESCVQGHHIYKRTWNPTFGEELSCVQETTNSEDVYAASRSVSF